MSNKSDSEEDIIKTRDNTLIPICCMPTYITHSRAFYGILIAEKIISIALLLYSTIIIIISEESPKNSYFYENRNDCWLQIPLFLLFLTISFVIRKQPYSVLHCSIFMWKLNLWIIVRTII